MSWLRNGTGRQCAIRLISSLFSSGAITLLLTLQTTQAELKVALIYYNKKKNGVINCFSLKDAKEKFKKDFKIPEFHEKNCVPSTIGTNFRAVLEASLK